MSREEILPTYKTPALVAHRKVKWAVTGSNRRPLRCNPPDIVSPNCRTGRSNSREQRSSPPAMPTRRSVVLARRGPLWIASGAVFRNRFQSWLLELRRLRSAPISRCPTRRRVPGRVRP
jgi:hypothetical protein